MNKTISINLGGIVFQVDENAYDLLKAYLASIRSKFSQTDGRDEIISDIEMRIAEMFSEKLNPRKQVIVMPDVEEVISIMGKPEDISYEAEEDEETEPTTEKTTGEAKKIKKRLFRNPDDKVLGGVCSGLSAYLGINESLWLRLIFLAAFFFGIGSSFFIYIILWVLMPEAKTSTEKLEMRGEDINLSNIEKTVKEEMETLKKRINEVDGKEVKKTTETFFERLASVFIVLLQLAVKFLAILFGILFFVVGLSLLLALLVTIIPVSVIGFVVPELTALLFASSTISGLASLGLALLLIVPVITLFYWGLRLFLGSKFKIRGLGTGLFLFWLLGAVLLGIAIVKTTSDFRQESSIRVNSIVEPAADTLLLKKLKNADTGWTQQQGKIQFGSEGFYMENGRVFMDNVRLNIIPSSDDLNRLEFYSSARGKTASVSAERVENMEYAWKQEGNTLLFPAEVNFPQEDRWRRQKLRITLSIPVGQVIWLDASLKDVIYDIANVHNMYDGKMVGHFWKMTEKGLTCISCTEEELDRKPSVKRESRTEDEDFRQEMKEFKEEMKRLKEDLKTI